MRHLLAAGLASVLLAAAQLPSQDQLPVNPEKNAVRTYVLKEGSGDEEGFRGKIKRVNGKDVYFTVSIPSGSMERRYSIDDFSPASAFRIMQEVTPETPQDQLQLAQYGLELNVPVQAKYALRQARKLSGDAKFGADVERRIRGLAAAELQEEFNTQVAEAHLSQARSTLAKLERNYSDVVSSNQINQMRASLETGQAQYAKDKVAARAAEASAREAKAFHRKLEPLRNRMDRAQEDIKRGLNAGSSIGQALNRFKRANRDLEHVVEGCEKLQEEFGNEASFASDINYVHQQAVASLNDSLLHSASIMTTRGSFNEALGNVNKILARDPNNTRALSMRGRIEVAANDDGWGYGGRVMGNR
ncbi:MAG: HlyD family secretion protein [Planctomycetota bacterium]|jgi:tetratricopeptide (TPR) repeat protein